MIDTFLAGGLSAYAPGEFLSLERRFHQLKDREDVDSRREANVVLRSFFRFPQGLGCVGGSQGAGGRRPNSIHGGGFA